MNTRSAALRPPYHRYCSCCGWGFTRNSWVSSRFCPGCGVRVAGGKNSVGSGGVVMGKAVRMSPSSARPVTTSTRISLNRAKISQLMGHVTDWVRNHPYLAAVMFAATGAGMVIAGPVVVACGAATLALGGTIIKTSIITGLIFTVLAACGASKSEPGDSKAGIAGIVVASIGTALGLVVTAFGAVLAALGAMMTGAGYVILAAVVLLLVLRAGKAIHAHRHEIAALVRSMRDQFRSLPNSRKSGSLPDGSKWDVDSLLAQVDFQLAQAGRSEGHRHSIPGRDASGKATA